MAYEVACRFLDLDSRHPRYSTMNLTANLHSWQVTAISSLVQIHDDPRTYAAIVANATGLGKTIQLLGFLIHVGVFRNSPLERQNTDCQIVGREDVCGVRHFTG